MATKQKVSSAARAVSPSASSRERMNRSWRSDHRRIGLLLPHEREGAVDLGPHVAGVFAFESVGEVRRRDPRELAVEQRQRLGRLRRDEADRARRIGVREVEGNEERVEERSLHVDVRTAARGLLGARAPPRLVRA